MNDLFPEVKPHLGIEDDNQRFTIERALTCVTTYDLDVAACEESHHAPNWYGYDPKRQHFYDGLALPWYGDVWCNPPWGDIGPWVKKAWRAWSEPEYDGLSLISVSMLLPGNRTHRPWWHEWVEPFRDGRRGHAERTLGLTMRGPWLDVHFAPERFPYGGPGNPRGIGVPEPNFTSVLLVWRR